MKTRFSHFSFLLFLPVLLYTPFGRQDPFLKVFFPKPFGQVVIGEVSSQIILSPYQKSLENRFSGFGKVDPNKPEEVRRYQEWENLLHHRWLQIRMKNPPEAVFEVSDISKPSPGTHYHYSIYISRPDGAGCWLFGLERPIHAQYFTINIDVADAPEIEKNRAWLDSMSHAKKKIRLSGKMVRIETSDLALFGKDKTETEFLDFYLSNIIFLH